MFGGFSEWTQLSLRHYRVGCHLEQRRWPHLSVLISPETLIVMPLARAI